MYKDFFPRLLHAVYIHVCTLYFILEYDICCIHTIFIIKIKDRESRDAVLEENSLSMELEITPVFLIPDTNCFIDHLAGLCKLVNTRKYTVVIPLIGELTGYTQMYKYAQIFRYCILRFATEI